MKLIKKGAEGDLFQTTWNSQQAILKMRKKKDYRNSQLDYKIRKQRTIRESQIITEVKSFGIPTPMIFFVDSEHFEIVMQKITGKLVKDLKDPLFIKTCKEIGKLVGLIHKNGIMHGDLTTSNFIVSNGKVFVMNFGLDKKTNKLEDHAVDLRLFKEILNSAHAKIIKKSWPAFLSGYKTVVGTSKFNKISKLVSVIESRGRYANVV